MANKLFDFGQKILNEPQYYHGFAIADLEEALRNEPPSMDWYEMIASVLQNASVTTRIRILSVCPQQGSEILRLFDLFDQRNLLKQLLFEIRELTEEDIESRDKKLQLLNAFGAERAQEIADMGDYLLSLELLRRELPEVAIRKIILHRSENAIFEELVKIEAKDPLGNELEEMLKMKADDLSNKDSFFVRQLLLNPDINVFSFTLDKSQEFRNLANCFSVVEDSWIEQKRDTIQKVMGLYMNKAYLEDLKEQYKVDTETLGIDVFLRLLEDWVDDCDVQNVINDYRTLVTEVKKLRQRMRQKFVFESNGIQVRTTRGTGGLDGCCIEFPMPGDSCPESQQQTLNTLIAKPILAESYEIFDNPKIMRNFLYRTKGNINPVPVVAPLDSETGKIPIKYVRMQEATLIPVAPAELLSVMMGKIGAWWGIDGGFFGIHYPELKGELAFHDLSALLIVDGIVLVPPVVCRSAFLIDENGIPDIQIISMENTEIIFPQVKSKRKEVMRLLHECQCPPNGTQSKDLLPFKVFQNGVLIYNTQCKSALPVKYRVEVGIRNGKIKYIKDDAQPHLEEQNDLIAQNGYVISFSKNLFEEFFEESGERLVKEGEHITETKVIAQMEDAKIIFSQPELRGKKAIRLRHECQCSPNDTQFSDLRFKVFPSDFLKSYANDVLIYTPYSGECTMPLQNRIEVGIQYGRIKYIMDDGKSHSIAQNGFVISFPKNLFEEFFEESGERLVKEGEHIKLKVAVQKDKERLYVHHAFSCGPLLLDKRKCPKYCQIEEDWHKDPALWENSDLAEEYFEEFRIAQMAPADWKVDIDETNPARAAIGITDDNRVVMFVGKPFTLLGLANKMTELECVVAMNTDGGGSAQLNDPNVYCYEPYGQKLGMPTDKLSLRNKAGEDIFSRKNEEIERNEERCLASAFVVVENHLERYRNWKFCPGTQGFSAAPDTVSEQEVDMNPESDLAAIERNLNKMVMEIFQQAEVEEYFQQLPGPRAVPLLRNVMVHEFVGHLRLESLCSSPPNKDDLKSLLVWLLKTLIKYTKDKHFDQSLDEVRKEYLSRKYREECISRGFDLYSIALQFIANVYGEYHTHYRFLKLRFFDGHNKHEACKILSISEEQTDDFLEKFKDVWQEFMRAYSYFLWCYWNLQAVDSKISSFLTRERRKKKVENISCLRLRVLLQKWIVQARSLREIYDDSNLGWCNFGSVRELAKMLRDCKEKGKISCNQPGIIFKVRRFYYAFDRIRKTILEKTFWRRDRATAD